MIYLLSFYDENGEEIVQEYKKGQRIVAPELSEGYRWSPEVPEYVSDDAPFEFTAVKEEVPTEPTEGEDTPVDPENPTTGENENPTEGNEPTEGENTGSEGENPSQGENTTNPSTDEENTNTDEPTDPAQGNTDPENNEGNTGNEGEDTPSNPTTGEGDESTEPTQGDDTPVDPENPTEGTEPTESENTGSEGENPSQGEEPTTDEPTEPTQGNTEDPSQEGEPTDPSTGEESTEPTQDNTNPENTEGNTETEATEEANKPAIIIEEVSFIEGLDTKEYAKTHDLQYFSVKSNGENVAGKDLGIVITRKLNKDKYKNFKVFTVNSDGSLEAVETTLNADGEYEFTVNELCNFVIANELVSGRVDLVSLIIGLATILVVEVIVIALLAKRLSKKERQAN